MKPIIDLTNELGLSKTSVYKIEEVKKNKILVGNKYYIPDEVFNLIVERKKNANATPKWIAKSSY